MANRDPERRHATRGAGGKFTRRPELAGDATTDPDPSTAAPDAGGSGYAAPIGPARAPDARDARARDAREPAAGAPFRLNIRAEDVTPGTPAASPPPMPGGFEVDPAVDVPAATMLAEGINTLVGMVGLPDANDAQVRRVGEKAAPVIRRVSTRLGLGDVAGAAVPEWMVEVGNLSIAVGVAWGPAAAVVVRSRVARRREEEANANGSAASGYGRAVAGRRDDSPAPWDPPAGDRDGGEVREARGPEPRNDDPADGGGLAALFALPGVGRPGPG